MNETTIHSVTTFTATTAHQTPNSKNTKQWLHTERLCTQSSPKYLLEGALDTSESVQPVNNCSNPAKPIRMSSIVGSRHTLHSWNCAKGIGLGVSFSVSLTFLPLRRPLVNDAKVARSNCLRAVPTCLSLYARGIERLCTQLLPKYLLEVALYATGTEQLCTQPSPKYKHITCLVKQSTENKRGQQCGRGYGNRGMLKVPQQLGLDYYNS